MAWRKFRVDLHAGCWRGTMVRACTIGANYLPGTHFSSVHVYKVHTLHIHMICKSAPEPRRPPRSAKYRGSELQLLYSYALHRKREEGR